MAAVRSWFGPVPRYAAGVDWAKTCAVVIPAFNEAGTIASLVRELHPRLPNVCVIDDGSTDDTAGAAAAAGAEVVRHPQNRGKGQALRTGLAAASGQGFAWALTMDGDGQHRPADIGRFFQCAEQTGADLVIGNRMHDAQAIPWLRRCVNRWLSRQLSRRAGRNLPDTQCGYRLIRLAVWSTLHLETARFEVESEMLLAVLDRGHAVAFVPITVVGRGPTSRIHPLIDTWRWLRWWRQTGRRRNNTARTAAP